MDNKSCAVSFKPSRESMPDQDIPIWKIDDYLQQSIFFMNTGPIDRVLAQFSPNDSRFTIAVYACTTIKHDTIPVVLPYETNVTAFSFTGIPVGDAFSVEKDLFEHAAEKLSLEIAADDGDNYYVRFLVCALHLKTY